MDGISIIPCIILDLGAVTLFAKCVVPMWAVQEYIHAQPCCDKNATNLHLALISSRAASRSGPVDLLGLDGSVAHANLFISPLCSSCFARGMIPTDFLSIPILSILLANSRAWLGFRSFSGEWRTLAIPALEKHILLLSPQKYNVVDVRSYRPASSMRRDS